jgi:hypothetical protein
MSAIANVWAGRDDDMEVGHETADGLVEVGAVSERTKGGAVGSPVDTYPTELTFV